MASTAAPLSRRCWMPSLGSKWSTMTSISDPGAGISPSNWSSGMTPSLLPPRSTNRLLPRATMTLPMRRPFAGFLAAVALVNLGAVRRPAFGGRCFGHVERLGIEAAERRLELGLEAHRPIAA